MSDTKIMTPDELSENRCDTCNEDLKEIKVCAVCFDSLCDDLIMYQKQNQKYREALENISKRNCSVDDCIEVYACEKGETNLSCVIKVAQKALQNGEK